MLERIFNFGKMEETEFLELLDGRLKILYKIAYSYFNEGNNAKDAVQDAVTTAYKNIHKIKDKKKFNSWITTILVNRCREILRRNKIINFQPYDAKVIDIRLLNEGKYAYDYEKVENKIYLINLLNKIDEKYKDVIRLKYFGDYTLVEISIILDIPLGTVKSRLNFAIKKLRELSEVNNNAL
ncbi:MULTISPECIES: RNA polymerase sigma factor [Clostridium]|uniref:Sigma-70 family RNA polymerase sigma factor n=1 Tax=Clostridium frigoriphilum TaxID=443253 RepID=A0ABU7UW69_9CLOT|nr:MULTISPECIES: sigma-70 family RNA polymerase sigma factor [Clostridium]MBU3101970.1 sigma-70 family RNA polymerase sigma factor [Clostridium sp. DSM 17811]MCB2358608.1 sigma-70 family RNA polymerase sigma factor [Clostridium estertheticum]